MELRALGIKNQQYLYRKFIQCVILLLDLTQCTLCNILRDKAICNNPGIKWHKQLPAQSVSMVIYDGIAWFQLQ